MYSEDKIISSIVKRAEEVSNLVFESLTEIDETLKPQLKLAKMFVPAFAAIGLAPVLAAVAVIIGHSKSCFLNFKGGKSVASGVGTILALNFLVGTIIAVIWALLLTQLNTFQSAQ